MDSEDEIREALVGWTITRIEWDREVEGGMVLDLERHRDGQIWRQRVTLGYTELGEWLEKVELIT